MAKKIRDAMVPLSLKQKLGLAETFNEADFQNALRLNSWQNEVIAFTPPTLMQLLNYAQTREQQVSLRTHIEKIINFAKVVALIRQADRPKIHVDGSTYVIAAPEDFEFALQVLGDTIRQTVSRLEKRQMQVLELFENNDILDKNQVAEKTGFSTLTAYRVLKVLSKAGYLKEIQTTKPYSYELLREKPNYHFNSIEKCENRLFWLEGLQKLVKTIISTFQLRGVKYSFEGVEEWIAKVKGQLESENNSITQSCKGEMVPFTPDLTPFLEKGQKHHFSGELKW
jgi:Fe2+ or Zn2+ uptake regulation protein